MTKRLVLMGATTGPWCGIREVKNPVIVVIGEPTVIDVELKCKTSTISLVTNLQCPGKYPLDKLSQAFDSQGWDWIRVARAPRGTTVMVVPNR